MLSTLLSAVSHIKFCFLAYEERALWLKVVKPLLTNQGPFWVSHLLTLTMKGVGGGLAATCSCPDAEVTF